ncbi:UNVERIFIED_CONTAM: hypothetical protein Cloal_3551 [Acetivibrio alkalicellulosi]
MSNVKDLLEQAIAKNELNKFLRGDGDYKVSVPHMVPVNIPTDWTNIIPNGIYKLFIENPNIGMDKIFENTLISMIDDDNLNLYVVINVLFEQISKEAENRSPFIIDRCKILPLLKSKLNQNRDDLKTDFRWMGIGEPEGLWSEIKRINTIMKKELRVSVI